MGDKNIFDKSDRAKRSSCSVQFDKAAQSQILGVQSCRLADALGLHLTQVKRYETGASQPSLEALKKIALTLNVSLDDLVFEDAERGPDEALKLKFEALRHFDPDERKIAEGVLDSLINNHQAKRLFARPEPEQRKRNSR